eukprot:CAMPEP_0201573906 /NCGR_PEP_ID=MMETSP0190_2-20130828/18010_1 /ASSEMBLY_ACC=CAM_ASM_000263 /TAXON_ID=37353 /ORGANISM="Rosalina sp." /LENGTH=162 /DNA_ID=CAMNT_0048001415 /DNA_START=194 /DNA_END=679 /DNA_ORIENTATION=-
MSDSSEPDKKRKRLSNYVVKPSSIPPQQPDAQPLRRSKRVKFKPLAFWANERIEHHQEILTYDKLEDAFENGNVSEIIKGQADELGGWQKKQQKSKKPRSKKKSTSKKKSKKTSKGKDKGKKKRRKKSESSDNMSHDEYDDNYIYDDDDDDDYDKQYDGNAW